jgi:hypothetical protein
MLLPHTTTNPNSLFFLFFFWFLVFGGKVLPLWLVMIKKKGLYILKQWIFFKGKKGGSKSPYLTSMVAKIMASCG